MTQMKRNLITTIFYILWIHVPRVALHNLTNKKLWSKVVAMWMISHFVSSITKIGDFLRLLVQIVAKNANQIFLD